MQNLDANVAMCAPADVGLNLHDEG